MSADLNSREGAFAPLAVFGNLYFAGSVPASVHVVDTGEGLVMLDTGYPHEVDMTVDNLRRLGLDPHDLKYILLTHGHIDHFGGARALKELTGAKIALGAPDAPCARGENDLSYAAEMDMAFTGVFEPDILISDGDTVTVGNTVFQAVATPGHTAGAMSWFFDVTDGIETVRAGLHGGMGTNTLTRAYLTRHGLPFSLRDDYVASMKRLMTEKVDLFLGNHMQHNHTPEKAKKVLAGDRRAFIVPGEWEAYCAWCVEHLAKMTEEADFR